MAYWLVKSEPSVYSYEQLEKDKKTSWDGVRNYAARKNLKAMEKEDKVLFYYSNEGLAIVAVAVVSKTSYQDPTTSDEAWISVELKAHKRLPHSVSLKQIKEDSRLADMELRRLGRLSVQRVTDKEWKIIMELSGIA